MSRIPLARASRARLPLALVVLLSVGIATPGILGRGDPVAANALWDWAMRESAGDLAHPAFVDATEAYGELRPWHPGYARARSRMRAVEAARLRHLAASTSSPRRQ